MIDRNYSHLENERMGANDNHSQRQYVYRIAGCSGKYTDVASAAIHSVKQVLVCAESKRKGPRGGVSEPFPSKLYDMLDGLEAEGMSYIAAWRDHGRCFEIADQDLFIKNVMPRYFKQSKLTSFQRQMNLYGFQKVSSGVDKGCFYHPLFLRGRPDICRVMLRTRAKGNYGTITRESDKEIICDSFYDLPSCPPSAVARSSEDSEDPEPSREEESQNTAPCSVSVPSSPLLLQASKSSSNPSKFLMAPPSAAPLLDTWYTSHETDKNRTPRFAMEISQEAQAIPLGIIAPPEDYYQSESHADRNVVSPLYGPQTSWLPILSEDSVTSFQYEDPDPFGDCTFQCLDDDGIQAYEESFDRRYRTLLS